MIITFQSDDTYSVCLSVGGGGGHSLMLGFEPSSLICVFSLLINDSPVPS